MSDTRRGRVYRVSWPEYHVKCDRCGDTDMLEGGYVFTGKDAEKAFRKRGWATRKGQWLCPTCLEANTTSTDPEVEK
jgi:hypothetical protein